MRLLMIGGARFSGRVLTGLAIERGHDVSVFHRGTSSDDPWPQARHVHADRADGFAPLAGERFDAVVDTCGYVPREVRASTAAFRDAGIYAYYSSLSAHLDDARIGATEDDDIHGPPFTWIDRSFAQEHGLLDDTSDPLPLWTPQIPGAHLFDTTRAEAAGLVTRSLTDTVADTLAWDDGRGAPWPMEAGLSDERERALLAARGAHT